MTWTPSRFFFAVAVLLIPTAVAAAADPQPTVLFDMDAVRHKPMDVEVRDKRKVPVGSAELVDGKVGKAVRFTFADVGRAGFFVAGIPGSPECDKADGFSFWVKGDGSDSLGGVTLIDKSDFGLRYAYAFPIDSTDWRKVTVRWTDLTPELAGPPVDPKATDPAAGYAPSRFGNLWFGKFYYWRDYPAHAYAIDHVALEPKIEPAAVPQAPAGLGRVRAKLQERKPITIVTMGDSLTDKRHWANRQTLWSELLAEQLRAAYRSEVTLVNPAVGGTTLSQNVVTMPKWSKAAPSPDLVVVFFGANDWDTKVRGPRYADYLRLAVDRIRRQTNGSADVLLLTTAPGHGRWETMAELEQAAGDVAKEKQTGLGDVATEFRKAGSPDAALKQGYWVDDKVHLGPKGHEVVRDVVLRALE